LRLVPKETSKVATIKDTANSLGLHDTLTYGPRSLAAEVKSTGGLRDRVENVCTCLVLSWVRLTNLFKQWEETQDMTKLTMLRNTYGMHAPLRLLMERKIVTSVSPLLLLDYKKRPC
jgi:proteasome maturation protein